MFGGGRQASENGSDAGTLPVPHDKEKGAGVMVSESNHFDEYHGMSDHDREILTARRVLRQAGWATGTSFLFSPSVILFARG